MTTYDYPGVLAQMHWVAGIQDAVSIADFECGFVTGDESNRVLSKAFHVRQVHGNAIVDLARIEAGNPDTIEADGVFTTTRGKLVAVKTADCLPVLVRSRKISHSDKVIAFAIHAGWRGVCAGIISRAIAIAESHNLSAQELSVVIGPAICSRHFEIGPEVLTCLQKHLGDKVAVIAAKGAGDRWHADLQTAAALELVSAGVPPAAMTIIRQCTHESMSLPSYRRDGKTCGRLVSWIRS
jgi:YfiH family protein